jgi:hypothetical protein
VWQASSSIGGFGTPVIRSWVPGWQFADLPSRAWLCALLSIIRRRSHRPFCDLPHTPFKSLKDVCESGSYPQHLVSRRALIPTRRRSLLPTSDKLRLSLDLFEITNVVVSPPPRSTDPLWPHPLPSTPTSHTRVLVLYPTLDAR